MGVALQPGFVMPGAWASIYGLLGATAVWVVCNDRCLPRAVATRMRTNVALDAVLLLLYFMIDSFVRWQELSGAAVGAAVALVFQGKASAFGPSPWRWAALAALVPLPWLGYTFIRHEMATNPEWAAVIQQANGQADEDDAERKAFQDAFVKRIHEETNRAYNVYRKEGGVLDLAPADRKQENVDRVKGRLAEERDDVKQLAADLSAAGPYKDERTENARKTALQFVETLNDLLTTAEKRLREGAEWTDEEPGKNSENQGRSRRLVQAPDVMRGLRSATPDRVAGKKTAMTLPPWCRPPTNFSVANDGCSERYGSLCCVRSTTGGFSRSCQPDGRTFG